MITHIRVKNFKSWKDSEQVEPRAVDGVFRDEQFWQEQSGADVVAA